MLRESDLHDYQQKAVEHILKKPRCGVFLEMGLGKTASTLTAIQILRKSNGTLRTLVVAPKRVALHTWDSEALKWEHLRDLTFSKAIGTRKQREKALRTQADIYVINVDNIVWLIKELGRSPFFDMVVFDEYSAFKNHDTQRFKAVKSYLSRYPHVRVVGLTGTPAPNSLEDLWSQVYLLDGGVRLERYITHFRQKYFIPLWGNGHIVYKWGLQPGAEEAIYSRIGDICISMKNEDYNTLPPVRYVDIPVALDSAEYRSYMKFKREQVLDLPTENGTDTITAANAAVLSGKIRQWLGGALYTSDGQEFVETNSAKIERLREMLEEIHTPVIIAYWFNHELSRLRKAFPQARTIDEPGVYDAWNRGEVPILLGHPASMGHGLNLQSGGHTIIWYTITWSLELYQQMNARLARQGQTERVDIYHLVCSNTLDERVVQVLRGKESLQNALMEAIKAEVQTGVKEGVCATS